MSNLDKSFNNTKENGKLILAVKPFFILYGILSLLRCCLIAYIYYFRYGKWDSSIALFIIICLPLMLFANHIIFFVT